MRVIWLMLVGQTAHQCPSERICVSVLFCGVFSSAVEHFSELENVYFYKR